MKIYKELDNLCQITGIRIQIRFQIQTKICPGDSLAHPLRHLIYTSTILCSQSAVLFLYAVQHFVVNYDRKHEHNPVIHYIPATFDHNLIQFQHSRNIHMINARVFHVM